MCQRELFCCCSPYRAVGVFNFIKKYFHLCLGSKTSVAKGNRYWRERKILPQSSVCWWWWCWECVTATASHSPEMVCFLHTKVLFLSEVYFPLYWSVTGCLPVGRRGNGMCGMMLIICFSSTVSGWRVVLRCLNRLCLERLRTSKRGSSSIFALFLFPFLFSTHSGGEAEFGAFIFRPFCVESVCMYVCNSNPSTRKGLRVVVKNAPYFTTIFLSVW